MFIVLRYTIKVNLIYKQYYAYHYLILIGIEILKIPNVFNLNNNLSKFNHK